MQHRHLSDDEIQILLDSAPEGVSFSTGYFREIRSCPECSRNVQAYRYLYRFLNSEDDFEPVAGFAEKTAAAMHVSGKPLFSWEAAAVAVCAAMAVAALFLALDLPQLWRHLRTLTFPRFDGFLLETGSRMLAWIQRNAGLYFPASCAVLLLIGIDKMISRSHRIHHPR